MIVFKRNPAKEIRDILDETAGEEIEYALIAFRKGEGHSPVLVTNMSKNQCKGMIAAIGKHIANHGTVGSILRPYDGELH